MAGKKAKAPSKPASKAVAKSAAKPTAKAAAKMAAKGGKADKGGALGSLKKMLGLGAAKSAPAKGAKGGASATAKASQGKSAGPAKGAKGVKGTAPAANGKLQAKAPAPAAGKKGQAEAKGAAAPKGKQSLKGQPGPLGDLRPAALRPQEPIQAAPPVCREVACELMSTTGGYCRMHYIKNWKKIKRKEMILKEKKLNSYIEELVSKYPDKYIEAIRQDLASEKDFAKVIADLEIDEGMDDFETVETESAEGLIDNIKRDFDDEGDVF